jgi:aspartyl-tRNA(Asn)/glutamyl-tRNA(Gln) amidotransferase subunit A
MTDLTALTLSEARDRLREKDITAVELTDAHIGAVEAARALNAFVKETPDHARAMARTSDAKLQKGEGGPLEGIPLGIKDLFCTKGVRTTACSKILGEFTPTYESTVTANLWRDGAVMLGKLNNDEFAMGSSNETSCFGPVVNPWRREGSNTTLVPGGSSGGSASAARAIARARSGVSSTKAFSARAASMAPRCASVSSSDVKVFAARCASVSSSEVKDLLARPSRASAIVSDVRSVIY